MIRRLDVWVTLRNTGEVLEWFSLIFLVPIVYSILFEFSWKTIAAFSIPMATTLLLGLILRKAFKSRYPSQRMHALAAVLLVWVLACFLAGIPFKMGIGKGWVDSVFQSTSALTTTGLDIFHGSAVNMSTIPRTYVLWINFLSWIGGAGIVMIALTGLISLFESSKLAMAEGREERIKPNLIHTARLIWEIYGIITGIGFVLLMITGLSPFDALNYAMSAVSTTGFTTGDMTQVTNPWVATVLSILLLAGATSFFAHYMFYKKDRLYYLKDTQILGMLALIVTGFFLVLIGIIPLYNQGAFKLAMFNVIGALTCGAFVTANLNLWLIRSQSSLLILALLMLIGGSAGSTSGGIKINRFLIFVKTLLWKIRKLAMPENAILVRKFEGKPIQSKLAESILLFSLTYILFIIIGTIILTLTGYPVFNSMFEVISAQSNAGLSLITNAGMNSLAKVTLIGNMIVGRLELIPFLTIIGFLLETKWRL